MKIITSLAALLALAAVSAPSAAMAGGHGHGHGTAVVVGGSAFVARPFFITRPFIVHPHLANRSFIFVQRPFRPHAFFVPHAFVPAQPVIVQRMIVLPGGTPFFFTSPTGFVVIR